MIIDWNLKSHYMFNTTKSWHYQWGVCKCYRDDHPTWVIVVDVDIYCFHFFGVAVGLLELQSCFLGDFLTGSSWSSAALFFLLVGSLWNVMLWLISTESPNKVRPATDPLSGLFLEYSRRETPYFMSLLAKSLHSSGEFGILALYNIQVCTWVQK